MAEEHEVYLPSECISLHSWRVKSGSSIKKGEIIAFGLLKTNDKSTTPTASRSSDITDEATSSKQELSTEAKNSILEQPQNNNSNSKNKFKSARSRMLAKAKAKTAMLSSSAISPSNTIKIVSPTDGFLTILDGSKRESKEERNTFKIATIGPCTHPTIIDNLCVVCGMSINDKLSKTSAAVYHHNTQTSSSSLSSNSIKKNTQNKTEKVTITGGITVQVTKSEANSIGQADQNRLKSLRKLSLVLDLDHTLVHATSDRRAALECKVRTDIRTILLPMFVQPTPPPPHLHHHHNLPLQPQAVIMKHYIKLRPHLKEFFDGVKELYEISIYTAGTRGYAQEVANCIARHVAGQDLEKEDIFRMKEELKRAETDLLHSSSYESNNKTNSTLTNVLSSSNNIETKIEKDDYRNETNKSDNKPCKSNVIIPILKKNDDRPKRSNDLNLKLDAQNSKTDLEHVVKKEDSNGLSENDTKDETKESLESSLKSSKKTNNRTMSTDKNKNEAENDLTLLHDKKRRRVVFTAPIIDQQQQKKAFVKKNLKHDPAFQQYIEELRKQVKKTELLEAKVMEIRNKIFGDRIVSRTDVGDLGRDVKSLKRVFPCGGSMAAIVDDRDVVWANATDNSTEGRPGEPPLNLLLVKPYKWCKFIGYEDVNNAAGVDLSTKNQPQTCPNESNDKRENGSINDSKANERETKSNNNCDDDNDGSDIQLLWTLDILKRLHAKFYSPNVSVIKRNTLTVPSALREMRKDVFGSVAGETNIVFSGLVPLIQQSIADRGNGPRPVVVRYAEELGATVLNDVSRKTTHIVAARDGTEKVLRGREIIGCSIVEASWLMECYWSMTRRDEGSHDVKPVSKKSIMLEEKRKQYQEKAKVLLSGSDESELDQDDDDDWMSEVETDINPNSK